MAKTKDRALAVRGLPLAFRHEGPGDLPVADRYELMGLIGIGVPIDDACHAVGLLPSRFKAWMTDTAPDDPLVEAFQQEVWTAEGRGVVQLVKSVHSPMGEGEIVEMNMSEVAQRKAVSDNRWKLLQKRRPKEFGGDGGVKVGVAVTNTPFSQTPGDDDQESAFSVVTTLEAYGVKVSNEVRETLGLPQEPKAPEPGDDPEDEPADEE